MSPLSRLACRCVGVALIPVFAAGRAAAAGVGDAPPDGGASHAPTDESLVATATCEHTASVGRFRCEVELRTLPPVAVRWADVQIVAVPPFVASLKSRVPPTEAAVAEPQLYRFALGLIAREKGAGEIEFRVRVVLCDGDACAPVVQSLRVSVALGRTPGLRQSSGLRPG